MQSVLTKTSFGNWLHETFRQIIDLGIGLQNSNDLNSSVEEEIRYHLIKSLILAQDERCRRA